jgi:hypothetical protein
MGRAIVLILHQRADAGAGPLERALASTRRLLAERLASAFRAAGADESRIVEGEPDDTPFGARLRSLAGPLGRDGLVVLGSGALPLARPVDLRPFVSLARSGARRARANGRSSADVIAFGRADLVAEIPDLPNDNVVPRWLEQVAGITVDAPRRGWRLAVDIDSPLDLVLAARAPGASRAVRDAARSVADAGPLIASRLEQVRRVMTDPRAELLVAGRTSATTLRWLETRTASRTRALVEERGLRASAALPGSAAAPPAPAQRPPASVLASLLEPEGRWSLGELTAHLADAAVIDSRVLLASRLGPDERAWPAAEDRFASDLLLVRGIRDPWLASLTASARDAPVPVLLGGHTLVGPALRLIARPTRASAVTAGRSGGAAGPADQDAAAAST